MSNFLTVYINQHEFLLMSFFESFATCNVIKIAWVADVKYFSVTLLTSQCVLKIKRFYTRLKSNYWKKCGESVSLLVHFVFFTFF